MNTKTKQQKHVADWQKSEGYYPDSQTLKTWAEQRDTAQHSPTARYAIADTQRERNNCVAEIVTERDQYKAHAQRLAAELEKCRDLLIAYRAAYCTSFSEDADAAIKSAYQALQDFGVPNAQKGGQ